MKADRIKSRLHVTHSKSLSNLREKKPILVDTHHHHHHHHHHHEPQTLSTPLNNLSHSEVPHAQPSVLDEDSDDTPFIRTRSLSGHEQFLMSPAAIYFRESITTASTSLMNHLNTDEARKKVQALTLVRWFWFFCLFVFILFFLLFFSSSAQNQYFKSLGRKNHKYCRPFQLS
jgi:hypothetical protein